MNRSVFTLLILAGAVTACDNSAPIKSSDVRAHFKEYCELTGGTHDLTKNIDSKKICICGSNECENRGCKSSGMECEDRELCDEEGDKIYKEEENGCVFYECIDGFYQSASCDGGVSCKRNEKGISVECGDCKNGTSSCKVEDGNAYIDICVSGEYEHRKCGSKYCYNGSCAECTDGMYEYRQEDGLCQKYECQYGTYVVAKINDCPSNVSCMYDENDQAICGECNDSDQSECSISDESQKAIITKCIKGKKVENECGTGFCYNNACAECSEGMITFKQEDNKCYSYTCHNGFFDKKDDENKCKDDVSCTYSEDGVSSCGECLNSNEAACKTNGNLNAYLQYCKNGELAEIECMSTACSSDNKTCASCGEDAKICLDGEEKSQTMICHNHMQDIKECTGSCNGDECGICKNGTIQCEAGKLKVCEHGKWDEPKDKNGCFTYNDKVYYCEDSATHKECTSICYNNQCLNKNQGAIVTDNAVVRRTPVITKVNEESKSKLDDYIVGYLNKGTVVDVVGKTDNDLYLLRFENHNNIKGYKNHGNWEDGKEYYYLKSDDILTENKSALESSETKIYFSKITKGDESFDKQFIQNNSDNEFSNNYDNVLKRTRKQAFLDAFNVNPTGDSTAENLEDIQKLYPVVAKNYNITQYFVVNQKEHRWKELGKNELSEEDMENVLRKFFVNKKNKEPIVIARVGLEDSSGKSWGMWNYLHYITIYGYDSGFKNGLFYIKDTVRGEQKCWVTSEEKYDTLDYKPYYATDKNIPRQAHQFYFFEKK